MSADDRPSAFARLAALAYLTPPFAMVGCAIAAASVDRADVTHLALGAAVLHQALFAVWARGRSRLRIQSVGGVLAVGAAASTMPSGAAAVVLMPCGFACVLVALGRVQTASIRGRAAHVLRRKDLLDDAPADGARRDLRAALLLVPGAVVAFLALPAVSWIVTQERRFADYLRRPADVTAEVPRITQRSGVGEPEPERRPRTPGPETKPKPATTDYETANPNLDRNVVAEIRPTLSDGEPAGPLGLLYLRGTPLVDDDGTWREDLSRLKRVADADDGRDDGWCDVASRPSPEDAIEFAVKQLGPFYAPTGEVVALAPAGTSSVKTESARAAPGGPILLDAGSRSTPFEYVLLGRRPQRVHMPSAATPCAKGDPRSDAPLGQSPAWAAFADEARSATVGALTDLERVNAVVRYLRSTYRYERVSDGLVGREALSVFYAHKRGTCLEFARAGVVMLRTLGLPARVGRGLLVGAYDEERDLYVARACDGHAWIEVAFESTGWTVFDPTPGNGSDWRWEEPPKPEGDGAEEGSGWLPNMDQTVRGARGLADALFAWVLDHLALCAAAAAVIAALSVRASRERKRRLAGDTARRALRRSAWDKLTVDLARRGWRRRPSQTASEFAAAVVATGGEAYRPFLALTERQQAVRFGGSPREAADDAAIEDFRRVLAAMDRPAEAPPPLPAG